MHSNDEVGLVFCEDADQTASLDFCASLIQNIAFRCLKRHLSDEKHMQFYFRIRAYETSLHWFSR